MNLSFNWLSDFVDVDKLPAPKQYCDRMTDTGSKVEGFEILGNDIENVVVGRIISTEKHPDADRLTICQIAVGEGDPVQIVTGASNIAAGDLVPVAKDGSTLPGGVKIKAGKLRGVPSNGMLCSIGELNLTLRDVPYAVEDGILILQESCEVGDDIRDVLNLWDTVVEFEITPNRPDCNSIIGLARETAASFDLPLNIKEPMVKGSGDDVNNYVSVEVRDPDLCPRYSCKVVKNVKIKPSPKWMRSRLRAMGVRPINNIVDITNYVMLEYGQPMHAFDYNYIDGGKIVVRRAAQGETVTTLDGNVRELTTDMLTISDSKKPVGLAGIMGGENSEINENTTTVVFESANFNGTSIRLTSRALGLRTDASGRYEKDIDTEYTMPALMRACELVEMLEAGDVVDGFIDVYPVKYQERKVEFSPEKIDKLLGLGLSREKMESILKSLYFKIEGDYLIPPSYRADVEQTADIAEEIARMYGYNNFPSANFKCEVKRGRYSPLAEFRNTVEEVVQALGLSEIQTYSFISPKTFNMLNMPENDPRRCAVKIINPLGEDTSVMRTTAVGSMLEVISHNRNFRNPAVSLYEFAKTYITDNPTLSDGNLPVEKTSLVMAFYDNGDFYDLKGMMDAVMQQSGVTKYEYISCADDSTFHPGRCAVVKDSDNVYATLGEIHPTVLKNYSIDIPVYLAVVDIDLLFANAKVTKEYKPLPKFPAITRDLAFVCDDSVEIGQLEKCIAKYAGNKLVAVTLFDIFTGARLGEGKKSVAFSLTLRDDNKTLTDEDADKITAKVIRGMEFDHSAVLRS
ncbi:MAG: phenylalanine--tRNA ligase subunit beta [Ruminococcaceae bacterium]|nr:phenylalanine--tRNA ligase subunit beta [Oscillospiraceae bacterium]